MHTKQSRSGAFRRGLLVLPALIVGVSLALPAAASAQTAVPFQASVNETFQKGQPLPPCPVADPEALFCASATIAGYGAATWTFDLSSSTSVSRSCFTYTGTSTFTLVSDPSSTLVLNENGLACNPGNSSVAPLHSYGHPLRANASWTVQSATGQFSGLTGNGTDTVRNNGAPLTGTYSGALLTP